MKGAELEKLCMSFKGTTQDIKWGNDLCYLIGGKMYCTTDLQGSQRISFKTTPEDFSELIERAGIIPAPYVARYHWVMVENPLALSSREWQHYVQKSYEMVHDKLPKKALNKLSAKGRNKL